MRLAIKIAACAIATVGGSGCDDREIDVRQFMSLEPQPAGYPEHTGEPVTVLPDPVIRIADESYIDEEYVAALKRMADDATASAWMHRFRAVAPESSSIILAEPTEPGFEGPYQPDTHKSTWRVHEQLAGQTVPTEIVIVQAARDGLLPSDALTGFPGRVDLLIVVHHVDGSFGLIHDGLSSYSFFSNTGDGFYQAANGPLIERQKLHQEAGKW